ncbi:MAG: Nif3-like dinuclear metal center hexameric protein [Planctomycetia bacterium]|nr:Nif3-like dinuclear metal center hexameric protein [Planctomycetia bacterium]
MPCVADIADFLERFSPPALAEDWDNVGLLVGDRQRDVGSIITCLTLTPDVAREAIDRKADLIVAHHPILFKAVKRITTDTAEGRMLLALLSAGIAVYSPHTAYDSADRGVNQQLAELLGLADIEALRKLPGPRECKIVCFVPRAHLAVVQEALWTAGAGTIGEYSKCSFVVDGTGSFEGSAASNPAVGQAQRLEQVEEARLEVICPERLVPEALRRLKAAHPYEEPACDVYPLAARDSAGGSGRMGTLQSSGGNSPVALRDFLALVREKLDVRVLPFVGELSQPVSRVAIACGAGGEFLNSAIAGQCNVLLTGEARFHTALEARTAGIALVLAGHFATERPAMEHLAAVLARAFPQAQVSASDSERDPIQWRG